MLKAYFLFQSEHFVPSSLICIWIFVCICGCERDYERLRKSETRICCSHIHLAPIEEAAKTLREAEGKESSKENFDDIVEQLS